MKVRRWGAAALAGLTALLAGCSGGQDSYNTVAPETDAVWSARWKPPAR